MVLMVWLIAKSLTIFLLSVVEQFSLHIFGNETIFKNLKQHNDLLNKLHSFMVEP